VLHGIQVDQVIAERLPIDHADHVIGRNEAISIAPTGFAMQRRKLAVAGS
jgi:hypothetical protein